MSLNPNKPASQRFLSHFHRPDSSQAKMAKQRAEAAVAVGRPLGWGVDGVDGEEIKFIDDTDTVCSSV